MNKEISISLFRVSSDSLYLDFIFSCPDDYYFDSLLLEARFFADGELHTQMFDLSPALFIINGPDSTIYKKHWTVRIPIAKLTGIPIINGAPVPAIYICTIKALKIIRHCSRMTEEYYYKNRFDDWVITNGELNETLHYDPTSDKFYDIEWNEVTAGTKNGEGRQWHFVNDVGLVVDADEPIFVSCDSCSVDDTQELVDTAVASDVNYAYRCMLDDLFMNENACEDMISDDIIRKYLLLYGHTAALAVRDMETALQYFKLIGNCFEKCSHSRGSGSCCGGGCSDTPKKIQKQSCNCGR